MWAAAVVKVMTRRQSNDYGTEISTEKSKIMANSTNNKCMDEQKLEEVTSVKYLRAASCKDGTCSDQDCHSNDQTKQDLVVQHHQLCKQVEVSCHIHPPLWL